VHRATGLGPVIGVTGVVFAALVTGGFALAGCTSHGTSTSDNQPVAQPGTPCATPSGLDVIQAAVGSEKECFFADQKVVTALKNDGFRGQPDYMGSRHMIALAATGGLSKYDVAFPASEPAAEAIQKKIPGATVHPVFSSPMTVATFSEIAQLLVREKIASKNPDGIWVCG
jgi:hypothetical protein